MTKKVNPRNIPRTQADVNRADKDGFRRGFVLCMDLMVFTIGTDFQNLPDDWLERFHERFMSHMDSYNKGYLTQHDMRQTALAEKGWGVELK